MATTTGLYYPSHGHHSLHVNIPDGKLRGVAAASHDIPKVPQSTLSRIQSTYRHSSPANSMANATHLDPEQGQRYMDHNAPGRNSNTESETYSVSPCSSQSSHAPSRSDNLKRRSSLREAARSIRTSRVAKRLRRQVRTGFDPEDVDDAGASASESDHSALPSSTYGPGESQYECPQPQRRPSAVSSFVNGLQSSLPIRTNGRGRGSTSSSSQSSTRATDNSDAASTNTSFTTWSSVSKRSRNMGDDDLDGDEDECGDRMGKRPCPVSSLESEQPQLFACPFAKHDPNRYSAANLEELNYRGCSQSYLTDLARVKQHLYRVHERPQHHCPTCFEIFKNQAQCMKHVAAQSCLPRPCPFHEKMTPEQLLAIKKKNRGTDPYVGWYEIYKTLFPGTQLPMSPYAAFAATVDTLESFMDYVIRQLPLRLRQELGFGNALADMVQQSLPEVLKDIRRDFNPCVATRSDSVSRDMADRAGKEESADPETSADLNFHQLVTMHSPQPGQNSGARPANIGLPPPSVYIYSPPLSTQSLSDAGSSSTPMPEQQGRRDFHSQYMHQQMQYDMQNLDLMQHVGGPPLTAIWQPEERESQDNYFVGQHQTQELLPTYSLQVEDSWIPTMVTSVPDNSMHPHAIPGMMGVMYPGGFGNHRR